MKIQAMAAALHGRKECLAALNLAVLLICAISLTSLAADEPTSTLKFEIVGGEKEQPVENASVYVKFVEERTLRPDKHIEWRGKTNHEGLATLKYVRRGKVLIQIVAEGWKTYGKYYDIMQDEQTIKIKLDRPRRWY